MIDINKCLYCDRTIENWDEKHFISECCGRGMCEYCFQSLIGTDLQIQVPNWDIEPQDEKILEQQGWQDADYLCYECLDKVT